MVMCDHVDLVFFLYWLDSVVGVLVLLAVPILLVPLPLPTIFDHVTFYFAIISLARKPCGFVVVRSAVISTSSVSNRASALFSSNGVDGLQIVFVNFVYGLLGLFWFLM